LANSYARHPFRDDALELAQVAADARLEVLADLNIALIEHCCERMGLAARRQRASAMGVQGKRTGRVVALCEALGATTYVSPPGAKQYLEEDGFTGLTAIPLEFHSFAAAPYPQHRVPGFVSHLSIFDVLANIGWARAALYVKQQSDPLRLP
jgi:hypothetical protein